MLDDLQLFVSIVDAGSLNAAARRLGVPTATLSRRLQALERELGCRLLHRSARRMELTAEGGQYYEQCRPLLQSLSQAAASLADSLYQVKGVLRVLSPLSLGNDVLVPVWRRMLRDYPDLRLELHLNNAIDDLLSGMADLALRVGEQPDSSLNQRQLGWVRTLLVAAPAYLAAQGEPRTPEDLARHALLVAEPFERWHLRRGDDGAAWELPPPRLRVNDMLLPRRLAEAGTGIAVCPHSLCHRQLAEGGLRQVLAGWEMPAQPVYAVWPQRRYPPARVRVLLDILAEFAETEPLLSRPAGI
ncbi:LysR family transcriptional regulator [Chromobacterium haemolyticum]|uniref:LysR family transcriptional regulator n=1 Tax=Chromobacterium fluminis TaxID=3044269 RepID=A0ABX0KVX7_9NEIS|nr:LysR family transcriptional regulator [Chromobacterium haemolyticum]NHR03694.1 LysR family transcriptional regulator [Chromobacterium haemolyticum]